jgi:dihydroneopterin aldolase
LLETLAEDIFDNLFLSKNIIKIKLRIEKPEIIKDTSSVGIEITKKKND